VGALWGPCGGLVGALWVQERFLEANDCGAQRHVNMYFFLHFDQSAVFGEAKLKLS